MYKNNSFKFECYILYNNFYIVIIIFIYYFTQNKI